MPPVLVSLSFRHKESGGLDFSKPPFNSLGVSIGLLYDGFFSFAVVRQMVSLFSC